jgi:alkaline phosphatase D
MKLTRRELLRLATRTAGLGMLPMSAWVAACGDDDDAVLGPETLFSHGVASGDPLADRVVLWTRISPETVGAVGVAWEIAEDPGFDRVVTGGAVMTDESLDYTVKVDADGLDAATTYYYRFRAQQRVSPTGRTRTAPAGMAERLRFAVASCSKYAEGYFVAYRAIAARHDLDAVIHLGDYIYENGDSGPVRPHSPPREIVSLADYRERYAQYRSDPDLQEAHRQHPFITVWDDHESTNNSWAGGADNHDPSEGDWFERKATAQRVYSEWMPIRVESPDRIFRRLAYGDLLDVIMLDTRLWGRDEQVPTEDVAAINDPQRSILGFDQEDWLRRRLLESTAVWKVVGQQVIFAQWKVTAAPNSQGGGLVGNNDSWDGYDASRRRVYELLRGNAIDNVVFLTGDVHSSWAMELTEDPNNPEAYDPRTGAGSLGVEFVAPGITNTFPIPGLESVFLNANPHLKWADTANRGYFVLDLDATRAQAAWFHFDRVDDPQAEEFFAAAFSTAAGENHLVEDAEPAPPDATRQPLAPRVG